MIASERITDDEILELESVLKIMGNSLSSDDDDKWVDADTRFHVLIARATKNYILRILGEALRELYRESIRELHSHYELRQKNEKTFERHKKIFEALKNHNKDQARMAIKEHFDATKPVIQALKERTDSPK